MWAFEQARASAVPGSCTWLRSASERINRRPDTAACPSPRGLLAQVFETCSLPHRPLARELRVEVAEKELDHVSMSARRAVLDTRLEAR